MTHSPVGALAPQALPELPAHPGVSFIMPVLNEAQTIAAAIATILAQDYDDEIEIVVALGPSTDDTTEIVTDIAATDRRVKIVHNPAGDTPTSLNLAVAQTSMPVIIRVDAHSELTPDYARRGVEVLRSTGAANCGGLMLARGTGAFQRAVARAYMSPLGLGGPAYHAGDEAQDAESAYLGIFRREVFEVLGGFDEELRRGQDWELNLRIRAAGGRIRFAPELQVVYRPRTSYKRIAQQFYATGIWRAEITRRYPRRASLRYFAPPLLVLGVSAALLEALLQVCGITGHWPKPLRRFTSLVHVPSLAYAGLVLRAGLRAEDAGALERAWFMLILPTMHITWGAGFLRGLVTGATGVTDRSRGTLLTATETAGDEAR
ncbi:glycosyltransferase family 2 protein [Brevibacterium sp. 91QC2O2]|uniref:glycosyltransferase family 2 protein n=1 Tax=Brevibacterium sp. 91QC2O2 TaxID=2968458 RepID=UPI00211D03B1|nr:glycosyltransferase family 2 protein [Brevibacterium sp. 91QC2O2]